MRTAERAQSEGAASKSLTGSRNGSRVQDASRNGAAGASRSSRGGGSVVDIQRARLLLAMTEVACEHGASKVTVADVVERAGVSRRTFYELFDDSETCFLAAFDEAVKRASRYVLEAYDPQVKWAERLRAALTGLLAFLDMEREVGQLLIVGSLEAGTMALKRRKRVFAQIIPVVDAGRSEGKAVAGLSPLTAEGVVGAVFSVIHGRLIEADDRPLIELVNPLMSMVAMPFLGLVAARRELEKPMPERAIRPQGATKDPLRALPMRITYRTVKVLIALAQNPGSSNREVGEAAGIADQGQISKLMRRLDRLGLVENRGPGLGSGEPNVWTLTPKGHEVEQTVAA